MIWGKFKFIYFSLLFFLIFFHFEACFLEKIEIEGNSMEPYLKNGDSIWIEKISSGIAMPVWDLPFSFPRKIFPHGFSNIKRGEVVLLIDPHKKKRLLIKRVIALAHDDYLFSQGFIYINEKLLKENYLKNGTLTPLRPQVDSLVSVKSSEETENWDPIALYSLQFGLPPQGKVPKGYILVLGDNRDYSRDSRIFGFVPISYIIAKPIKFKIP